MTEVQKATEDGKIILDLEKQFKELQQRIIDARHLILLGAPELSNDASARVALVVRNAFPGHNSQEASDGYRYLFQKESLTHILKVQIKSGNVFGPYDHDGEIWFNVLDPKSVPSQWSLMK